ncbi:MAG: hypothetical protein NTW74_20735 [Acidobacteria bacterium]|nr:hypothetical protein [Acidobacteriota bacterium]
MPDGNEEREDLRTRLEEQKRENTETWIDREDLIDDEPERDDS